MKGFARILLAATLALAGGAIDAQDAGMKKWTKGKGWDGSGDLRTKLAALKLVTQERPTTLACLLYDRYSYKWPGHSRGEIIASARPRGASRHPRAATDHGVAQQRDLHKRQCRDADRRGLGHITHDPKNEFYNGFTSDEWGGDFGLRNADVTTIPPIVARGVLLDIAGLKNVEALPSAYEITVEDVDGALRAQNVDVTPGTVVLLRTGTARYWGENGRDHAKIGQHDSAGIGLTAAKYLVEQKGALALGSDTSGLEYVPPKPPIPRPWAAASTRCTCTSSCSRACTSWSSTISSGSRLTGSTSSLIS